MTDKHKGPLSGIRVLEMGRLIAAPSCGQVLADLGADVIKIERVGTGDDIRGYGPPFLGDEAGPGSTSCFFLAFNRNKRSIAIDFSKKEGADLIRALAAKSDVFIENYKVGSLRKYGLDEEGIRKACQNIIYLSVSGFGQDGPYASRASTDVIIQGMSGLMSVTGESDRPPMKVGAPVADIVTGLYGAVGVLAALQQRSRSDGHGDWVGVSLLDSCMSLMAPSIVWSNMTGNVATRIGNSALGSAPSGVFSCSDGHILIQAGKDTDFVKLCDILGLENLARDQRFSIRAARVENEAELTPLLQNAVAKWERERLYATMLAAGIICGPVNDVAQALSDPQVKGNNVQISAKYAEHPDVTLVANPIKFRNATAGDIRHHPPRLGEHTEIILQEVLGFGREQISTLSKSNVIATQRHSAS